MLNSPTFTTLPRWDLAAEAIVVKIRWFGLVLGFCYVNIGPASGDASRENAILLLGLVYTLFDTWKYRQQRVFLGEFPLMVSMMESLFIGLLCLFDQNLDSPFRYYYLLSLLCCALRHSIHITYMTCLLHCISYVCLYLSLDPPKGSEFTLLSLVTILIWLTWASSAMSRILRDAGTHLQNLNSALRENQILLESRIEERTRELQETQAQLMHQDKMAGFGLLAAGIAHEVGNPLTSISSIVQILEKRNPDDYTREKFSLVSGQLSRIQGILRELTTFSRPANHDRTQFAVRDIIDEALNIAKYYKGGKNRTLTSEIATNLPPIKGIRDQLVQVIFNLVLNAIDATSKGGLIELKAEAQDKFVRITVRDNGSGIDTTNMERVFKPYFTTKKQGTGLGLFVTRKIIGEHGGWVDFESKPNEGTTFHVNLPV